MIFSLTSKGNIFSPELEKNSGLNKCYLQGSRATGAFILTTSHNPGGPNEVSTAVFYS